MITIPIKGDGSRVVIEVAGYGQAAATGNDSGANWLVGEVVVTAGPFSGRLDANFTTDGFAALDRDLAKALKALTGKVAFAPDYGSTLRLTVEMTSLGHATVAGSLRHQTEFSASLDFEFATDQTYLAETRSALAALAKEFPVKAR